MARVSNDHRYPDATFVDVALRALEAAIESFVVRRFARFEHVGGVEECGSVVTCEQHNSVLVLPVFFQALQYLTNAPVHDLDHGVGGRDDPIESLFQVLVHDFTGGLERRVRRAVGQFEKERFLVVPADEIDGFVCQYVCQVSTIRLRIDVVVAKLVLVVVHPAATESHELFESAGVGFKARVECAVMPFANQSGRIPSRSEAVGDGAFVQADTIQAVYFVLRDSAGAMRIPAGQKAGSRGGTDGRGSVMLREADALLSQIVQVGCRHDWIEST